MGNRLNDTNTLCAVGYCILKCLKNLTKRANSQNMHTQTHRRYKHTLHIPRNDFLFRFIMAAPKPNVLLLHKTELECKIFFKIYIKIYFNISKIILNTNKPNIQRAINYKIRQNDKLYIHYI